MLTAIDLSHFRSSYSSKPSSVANPVVVHTCPVTNGSTQANASFKNPSSPGEFHMYSDLQMAILFQNFLRGFFL